MNMKIVCAIATLTIAGTYSSGALAQPEQIVTANPAGPYLAATLEAWGKGFTQETGIKVLGDGPVSIPKLQQMVKAGNVSWDVVEVPPNYTLRHCGTLFEKLPEDLQNRKDVLPGFGNACGVPASGYAYIMLYNTKKFPNGGPKDWADFFDVKKFPGIRAIRNSVQGVTLEVALLADGVAPKDLYPLDLDRAFRKLTELRPNLVFWQTGAQSTQMMESQEVDMIMAWSTRAYPALKNGAPFEPVWNQQFIYNNVLAIPKGAPYPKASADYIRYATNGARQEKLAELYPVTPAVLTAKPKLDEVGMKLFAGTPDRIATSITPNLQWVADHETEIQQRWLEWFNK
ncbi:ABC transporter substrate-binding protein [Alcaligenaceae bacterium]|nr:ABC transporter substrate-binding protein [Alcaligenaceae bacterium]